MGESTGVYDGTPLVLKVFTAPRRRAGFNSPALSPGAWAWYT